MGSTKVLIIVIVWVYLAGTPVSTNFRRLAIPVRTDKFVYSYAFIVLLLLV